MEEEYLGCPVSANTGKDENAVSGDLGGRAFTTGLPPLLSKADYSSH